MVDTTEKIRVIRKRMKAAQSRQKTYADRRRRPLEFAEGDKVFLKISPMKEVIQIGKRNKLDPRSSVLLRYWKELDHWLTG